jgi:hypothetical protein
MSDYGFEVRRPDGSVRLTTRETIGRFVHIERVAGGSPTTFSVPDFDATESGGVFTGRGFFYIQYVCRYRENNSGSSFIAYGAMINPTLNWDNTTKVMSFSPANIPSGWPFGTRPDYDIIFIHFR